MEEPEWAYKVTSTLFITLSREMADAVQIAEDMDWVKLLNNK